MGAELQRAERIVQKPFMMPIVAGFLQRSAACPAPEAVPPIVHEVLRSPGTPLDRDTRDFMEPRFGHDFSRVRVHTDAKAAESARAVNALAFTAGRDVVFGAGQFSCASAGRKLVAHELRHALQQAADGNVPVPPSLQVNKPGDACECEADQVSAEVVSGGRARNIGTITSASPSIQRSLRVDDPGVPAKDPMDSPYIIFQDALARITDKIVTYVGDDLYVYKENLGQPIRVTEQFVRRAIDSKHIYRLRLGKTDLGGRQVRGGSWELRGNDVVITLNPSHIGEFTWTVDELLAKQLVSAVAANDPEAIPTVDIMLTDRLPYGSTDNTKPEEIKRLQSNSAHKVEKYLNENKQLKHLTPRQQARVKASVFYADGVSLLEIIHGVETNTPYRIMERREGDRVFVRYNDPNVMLGEIGTRRATFVPGEDVAAGPVQLPLTGVAGRCNDEQNKAESNSCCTRAMMDEIKAHIQTARTFTQRAIGLLGDGTDVDCYLKRNFGDQGTSAHQREIKMRLGVMLGELHLSHHGWKCREKASGLLGCVKRDLGTVGGKTNPNDVNIVLCVNDEARYTNWIDVLHEVAHRSGVHGKETYKGQSDYPGKNALGNADSYAHLVEELGSPDSKPCK